MIQKTLLFILVLLSALTARAYDAQIGGIYYNLYSSTKEATVTCYNYYVGNMYKNNVIIPATVTYKDETYSVTQIDAYAFRNCSALASLKIPKSVISINSGTFEGCSGLVSISIESGNTKYDSRNNCNAIIETESNTLIVGCNNTVIPNSVTAIENKAFRDCSSLMSITIPNSVTTIKDWAFNNCSALKSVIIGSEVTSIGYCAFYKCSSLTSVTINSNAIASAWSYISNIFGSQVTEYILGEGVTSIRESAFSGCSALKSITIPYSVTTIGNSAFYGCSSLTSITIPNSVIEIGNSVFSGCSGLTSVTIPYSVTSIGNDAFRGCSGLTSISIPNSVTEIGNSVFSGCSGLTSMTIPYSVTTIGNSAFYGCSSLTSITIPNSVTTIKDWAFNNCSALKTLIIGSEVTSIGNSAFSGCSGLTSIFVESGNTVYDSRNNCNAIIETSTNTLLTGCKETVIPNSVISIGSAAFYNCSRMTSITIPNSVTSIGNGAFHGCTGELTVNCNIPSEAFSGSNFSSVKIEDGVISIGRRAFRGCSSLISVTIGNSVTEIGTEAFYECSKLTSITIPNSVTLIENGAFYGCEGLTSITIPSSITSIRGNVFSCCYGLTSVTIPNSVTSIGSSAFNGCTNIKLYLDKNSVALFDLWNNIIKSSTPQMYCKDCIYDINTGKKISLFEKTCSSVRVDEFVPKNYTLISQSLSINGKKTTMPYYVKGLNSNTSIGEMVLTIEYIDSFGDSQAFRDSENVSTEAINLTTLQPKVISAGNVIVGAESNLDDEETKVGFEWRRTDWTDEFASNIGGAYLYGGKVEGYIRNMYTEKLWKYRPYYESNSGNRYYGDWVGIDPTNTSYFEPTVYTYSTNNVSDNTAEVKGYAMRGTDNITSQGFLYWKASPQPSSKARENHAPVIPANAKMVEAKGNVMIATLENLDYDTEYRYVAFVTTSEGETFYGEEQTFWTGMSQDMIDKTESLASSLSKSEGGIYDLQGRKLSVLQKGINIIRMSDGTVRKVMIK